MVSETSLPPIIGRAPASTPAVTVDLGHPRMVGRAISRIGHPRIVGRADSRIGHFIASSLEAPYLPVEPFIEAQALMGLPIKTLSNPDIFFGN